MAPTYELKPINNKKLQKKKKMKTNVHLNVDQIYIDTDDVMDSRADEQCNLYLKKEGGAAEYPDEFMYINPQDGKIYLKQGNIFKLQMFPTE